MFKIKSLLFLLVVLVFFSAGIVMAADTADVIFVVDESGSMAGEHAWIANMVTDLDTSLSTAGVTNNRYGIVGFGASNPAPTTVQTWGTAGQASAATGNLVTNGGTEDGWAGISYALNNYSFRSNAGVQIVLITDEDRDNYYGSLSYNSVLAELHAKNAMLNVVVNANFSSDNGAALGMFAAGTDLDDTTADVDENAILVDGSGGYTLSSNGAVISAYGTTNADYITMAHATEGAAWNLNVLRRGGLDAESFTNAFVDFKTEEIIIQPPSNSVPEPATLFLFGSGLLGIAGFRRKMKK